MSLGHAALRGICDIDRTLSVLLEEIMLAYLAISHVSGVVSEYASFGAGFREVGGFFVVNTTISGA